MKILITKPARCLILTCIFVLTACRPAIQAVSPPKALAPPTPISTPTTVPVMSEEIKRIEVYLDTLNKSDLFSGVVLIARDGQIVLSKGYGLADHKSKTPNISQTSFRIGELSMQFTAAAMLLLEQDGKLNMQDAICKYLDDCPESWKDITIHQLLSHTSGIPDYLDSADGQKAIRDGTTPQQLMVILRNRMLDSKPGGQRAFSRSGFVLAGLIIERISGQSYGDFVTKRIFVPLGMTNSGYGDPPAGLAIGYSSSVSNTPYAFNISALYAAGGCYSSADDLYRWNEGMHSEKLLNTAQLNKMLTNHAAIPSSKNGGKSGYGIVLFDSANRKVAGNGGGPDNFGYSATLYRFIDDHVTLITLTNEPLSDQFDLMDQIGKLYFGAS